GLWPRTGLPQDSDRAWPRRSSAYSPSSRPLGGASGSRIPALSSGGLGEMPRVGQAVSLHQPYLPPEVQARGRHNDEDLEQNPDVHSREQMVERQHLEIVEAEAHGFVEDGRGEKEQCDVACELVPALVGVVEGLAEHEAEEVMAGPLAHP